MRKILRHFIAIILIIGLNSQFLIGFGNVNAANDDYTTYRSVDKNSFNEYRYLITKEFFNVRSRWKIDEILDSSSLIKIKDLAEKGFKYLPDNNLKNESLFNNLTTAIAKAIKYDNSDAAYVGLVKAIGPYLDDSSINSISGEVIALPKEGNAPFNVTLRAKVSDPSGETIPKYNYVWWMNSGSRKVNLGTGPSINYTFKEEGNFTVFVDVKSVHKNSKGYIDVLPFRGKADIKVKEKVASLIVKVNSTRVGNREILKFTPTQAKYGLLFDATSSVPTGSAKFIKTQWDFGNGVKKSYSRAPKVERIVYSGEGEFDVTLKLKTNLGKTIEKEFVVSIHDPIATIQVNPSEGFLGDKFTISALNVTNDKDLTYNWSIVDIIDDKVIFSKQTKLFTYNFKKKGHFNIRLEVNGTTTGNKSIDTKNIYINSRAPVAQFKSKIAEKNKPNRILLDGTSSYDPDFTDTGKLKYSWEIDGQRVLLEDANFNGSLGFYTFETTGDHSVVLRVEDPDNIEGVIKGKVEVLSDLSVDFSSNPRAIKRGNSIEFNAISPKAKFFEWDFGDGIKSTGGVEEKISHKYEKTGIFTVKLKVTDKLGRSNTQSKVVYVGDGEKPVAILKVGNNNNNINIAKNACNGNDAFIVDRINSVNISAEDSINIDGNNNGLDYSIKIGANKYYTTKQVSYKFDELGCFPIVLKVTSQKTLKTDTKKLWIKVENIKPTLSALQTRIDSLETDPVIVSLDAINANDADGVITSYLWYYYTDLDDEPQDFRSTTGPSTKFVLPKITGNYYFVVLLTDDSDARVSSKELGKMASLTLAGNNLNVPIVELKTPDNSVHVEDEVIFNAKVQNILKQNLSKKVKYYWDFDGDGFYDLETKKPSVTYAYNKPGTYYAKLKVKYKGFSNSKTIQINVVNSLIPALDYISLGNKFIFINKTTGSYENISFDLGDGTKIKDEDYFTHVYTDGKSSHTIKIIASDGNTVKKKEVKVVKSIQNLLKNKQSKSGILFSTPESNSKNEITIDKRVSNITIFFSGKKSDFSEISADLDLNKDSDLNGAKDDDIDITSSKDPYINIKLDNKKNQLIRVFVKDSDGVVTNSKDYKIVKNYIKDNDINLDDVVFSNVSSSQKQKLEELKELANSVSGDDKKIVKTYVARLKDEWSDENERTKLIYEFEGFLDGSTIQNKDEIIDKLESLLLKENDDSDIKTTALRALQGLTPADINCGENFDLKEYKTCKSFIDSSLEAIKSNNDLEQNKILGKTILDTIGRSDKLTTSEKLDYKATLQTLIYGNVDNIPKNEVKEVVDNPDNSGSIITTILKYIGYILLAIIILLSLGFGGFFIYSKLSNKNGNKSFEDFIAEKTGNKEDVFEEENKKEDIKNDIFTEEKSDIKKPEIKKEIKQEEKIEEIKKDKVKEVKNEVKEAKEEDVPDWLKGTLDDNETSSQPSPSQEKEQELIKPEKKIEEVKELKQEENLEEITKVEDDNIPDWLKGSIEEKKPSSQPSPSGEKEQELNKIEKTKENKQEDDIPDWLKGSLDETETSSQPSPSQEKEQELNKVKEEKQEEKKKEIKKEEEPKKNNIPKKTTTKKVEKKPESEEKVVEKTETTKNTPTKKRTTRKSPTKKSTTKKVEEKEIEVVDTKKKPKEEVKKSENIENTKAQKQEKPKQDKKADETKKDTSDLWDDGMDIPDWLKN